VVHVLGQHDFIISDDVAYLPGESGHTLRAAPQRFANGCATFDSLPR
jgi:hypothetical protein